MVDRDLPVTEEELHAHVDAQLPADRRAAVEHWLAEHPDDLARVTGWRAQAEAIRARYGAVADEPVPVVGRATVEECLSLGVIVAVVASFAPAAVLAMLVTCRAVVSVLRLILVLVAVTLERPPAADARMLRRKPSAPGAS